MPQYLAILWIPYLALIYKLYKQRSVWTPIVLLISAAFYYRLPLLAGYDGRMFHIGLLFCITISLMDLAISRHRKKEEYDRVIWNGVFIYFCFLAVSVIPATYDRLPTKVYVLLDYSLLFFVCFRCLKNEKDTKTLLKGLVFVAFLMAAIGVIGYVLEDPWWGQNACDDPGIQIARSQTHATFAEKFHIAQIVNRNISRSLRTRVVSTAGSPNSFGITLLFASFLIMYFWFREKRLRFKQALTALMALMVIGIILSGSRTTYLAGIITYLLIFAMLVKFKRIKARFFHVLVGAIVIASIVFGAVSYQYLSKYAIKRVMVMERIDTLIETQERTIRWKYAITQMPITVLGIGTGHPGAKGTSGAHNAYLSIIYMGGVWCFCAFCIFFVRAIRNALHMEDSLMGLWLVAILFAYAISGITLENNHAIGPGYIFWPVIAILAKREICKPISYERGNK